ncbi:alpha-mannosidase [Listeria costaricensis]|uniref:alpha-mannosidase n=1 Tax=Listeria costaricensis TaxID=2026604 RepID=UPI000C06C1C8|nr:alpha-mannosidase [Listeria costaricensis]
MKKMHMIGNAHIDPIWLWRWQEGFQETKATFRSALDRLAEYEDFIFTSSSAAIYQWVERNDPEMFEEIRQRVQEGRWVICGGWWMQPDCNIPSGESFARQGLQGQCYFEEKFGVMAKVGYNVDSFGHNGMLPQILKKSGMDHYLFMRPAPDEKGLPARLFLWESADGSRVSAFRLPFEYCTFGKIREHVALCESEFAASSDHLMSFYGVGNHGGGPTKENIETVKELMAEKDYEILFSSPNAFFEEVTDLNLELPVVHDDLQHHASGCYSVHSEIKRDNRLGENMLVAAEKFGVLAAKLLQKPYPDNLQHAWQGLLFNQFHDILAGTCIKPAYEDAKDLNGEVKAIAAREMNEALQAISWKINIEQEDGMKPIVIFNPHSWPVKANIEVEWGVFGNYPFPKAFHVVASNGEIIPYQRLTAHAKTPGVKRIGFIAELPPLGYTVYKIKKAEVETHASENVCATAQSLENNRFKLLLDTKTGAIKSLFDKVHQVEVFNGLAALPVAINDSGDTWAPQKLLFNDKAGQFEAVRMRILEEGPVKSTLQVQSVYEKSTIIQEFTLFNELDFVEVAVKINWQEPAKMLKFEFPVSTVQRQPLYEIPFGMIQREANGEEEPMQNWFDVTGIIKETKQRYGVAIINDSKYSASVTGHVMGLTALRSTIYAQHDPYEVDPEEVYDYIDQGIQYMRYRIVPHAGAAREARLTQRGLELNQPEQVVIESYHPGPLPETDSLIEISNEQVILSAMKEAEDHQGVILRFAETTGSKAQTVIQLPKWGQRLEVEFGPLEVKTYRLMDDGVTEVNLIEK